MPAIHCPNCDVLIPAQEVADGWCESCGKKIPAYVLNGTGRRSEYTTSPRSTYCERPRPVQSLALARVMLLIVAAWWILSLLLEQSMVEREFSKARAFGVSEQTVLEKEAEVQVLFGCYIGMAALNALLAACLSLNPRGLAITALVVFIAFILICAMIYPPTLFAGLLGKLLIFACLTTAIQKSPSRN